MRRGETHLPLRPGVRKQPPGAGPKTPCIFFARGACRKGEACSFSHSTPGTIPAETAGDNNVTPGVVPPPVDATDSRSQIPCHFYLKGSCLKGTACPFAHPPRDQNGSDDVEASDVNDPEPAGKPDSWIREIGGALVQFGDGIAIVKTSLPSDFSAIHISMLPPDSSPSSVSQLLADLGFEVPTECIRVPPLPGKTHCIASVRVENPTFAKRVCDVVGKIPDSKIKVAVTNAPMTRGSSLQRVECKKVHCSWHRPLKTVWLNFRSKGIATKVESKFAAGTYTICGRTVKSSDVTVGAVRSHRHRGGTRIGEAQSWTVMLTEVPGEATEAEVEKTIVYGLRPYHVELGKTGQVYDMATANALVKSKLAEFGPLDWWEDASKTGAGKRAKAKARFQEEGDASEAAAALDGWKIPFRSGANVQLNIQAIYSTRFKVTTRIFSVVEAAIDTLRPSWLAKHVFFTPYKVSGPNGHAVLRLEGVDKDAIIKAKASLEEILAGQTAVDAQGKDIWTPSFSANSVVFQRLKTLEETLGIVIVRNKRLSRLQLFGPSDKCKEAQASLAKLAAEDPSTLHTIALTTPQFEWACLGGFRGLMQLLGRKVNFDITSTPKQILVTGTDADYRLALAAVTARKQPASSPTPTSAAEEAQDCTICWTPADNPVLTPCGHTYCASCFEAFCFASSPPNLLKCEGALGKCHAVISLAALADLLPSLATLEDLFATSFTSHVRSHPHIFRPCPTPDCIHLYRVTADAGGGVFTCPACLAATCTGCHVAGGHRGVSCAGYKAALEGGGEVLEKLKRELGVRDCKQCGTSMEKVDGCNHVVCGGCKTHICWKCGETFTTSDDCYGHLRKRHGGIFEYED
ncbi:hypothetical protein QBC39DRAFT_381089 [Podospora conica]|nr:hypothetical protein QBC39DRAFT_381089 [Schizothecium conicum]